MKLKNNLKLTALFVALAGITCLISCDKKDSTGPFGFTNIYIPQATVSGGVNNNYLVPSGLDTNTYNYKIDIKNNKVDVFLGVSRSGTQANGAYSVNVTTKPDTINQLIANGLLSIGGDANKTVVLLPSSAYTLPATIAVPQGQNMANFNLVIDEPALKAYAGEKVALCVAITNPTNYTLSPAYNQVIILIDVDSLNLP
jgi:hypothetical protein